MLRIPPRTRENSGGRHHRESRPGERSSKDRADHPGREQEEHYLAAEDNDASIALVTGAASGIGAAVVARLTGRGWKVAGVDLRGSETDLPLVADVADRGAVREAADRAAHELGPVSLLVTVAGHYEMFPVSKIGNERWQRMLSVHLGGTRNACAAVLPSMLEAGRGTIITTSSELALGGGEGHYHRLYQEPCGRGRREGGAGQLRRARPDRYAAALPGLTLEGSRLPPAPTPTPPGAPGGDRRDGALSGRGGRLLLRAGALPERRRRDLMSRFTRRRSR